MSLDGMVVSLIKDNDDKTDRARTSVLSAVNPWHCQLFRRSCRLPRHLVHMSFRQRDHTHYLGLGIVQDPHPLLLAVLELH